ncbi:hypothetical protein LY78DRAFT_153196 [Colletotrichum sublineola]|nr:hypothetical protein LY78DRAFT_153196 [Colletotrichum sublineola]
MDGTISEAAALGLASNRRAPRIGGEEEGGNSADPRYGPFRDVYSARDIDRASGKREYGQSSYELRLGASFVRCTGSIVGHARSIRAGPSVHPYRSLGSTTETLSFFSASARGRLFTASFFFSSTAEEEEEGNAPGSRKIRVCLSHRGNGGEPAECMAGVSRVLGCWGLAGYRVFFFLSSFSARWAAMKCQRVAAVTSRERAWAVLPRVAWPGLREGDGR